MDLAGCLGIVEHNASHVGVVQTVFAQHLAGAGAEQHTFHHRRCTETHAYIEFFVNAGLLFGLAFYVLQIKFFLDFLDGRTACALAKVWAFAR